MNFGRFQLNDTQIIHYQVGYYLKPSSEWSTLANVLRQRLLKHSYAFEEWVYVFSIESI